MSCSRTTLQGLHSVAATRNVINRAATQPGVCRLTASHGVRTLVHQPLRPARKSVVVQAFKFSKLLSFLPDSKLQPRLAVLHHFFAGINRQTLEELLDPAFSCVEEGQEEQRYNRAEWIKLMCDCIGPAVPDFNWTHATDGKVDDAGYAVVTVQACGYHTGAPLAMMDLKPVPPSGQRFSLHPQIMKVKVEQGKVKEIIGMKGEHSGPLALYKELAKLASLPQPQ